jgi:cbb3-type cytochrome oxidase subunit 3
MNHFDLIAWSKIAAMAIFLPLYLGFLAYVFWKPNRARLEALARIPLQDD